MTPTFEHLVLPFILAVIATLYSSVGQAGGTGYIAIMGLIGYGPDVIKPAALALNIAVATIGCVRFARAGLLTWRSCYPFAIFGAPFSVLGGATALPAHLYHPTVGVLLLLASALMLRSARMAAWLDSSAPPVPPFLPSLVAGAVLGFISGITGVGGGIFLAPLVLALGWASTRQVSGISVMFNLLNSGAALAGAWATTPALPPALPSWLTAVGAGALLGSWLGSRHLPPMLLRYILAVILLAAGVRMVAW